MVVPRLAPAPQSQWAQPNFGSTVIYDSDGCGAIRHDRAMSTVILNVISVAVVLNLEILALMFIFTSVYRWRWNVERPSRHRMPTLYRRDEETEVKDAEPTGQ